MQSMIWVFFAVFGPVLSGFSGPHIRAQVICLMRIDNLCKGYARPPFVRL